MPKPQPRGRKPRPDPGKSTPRSRRPKAKSRCGRARRAPAPRRDEKDVLLRLEEILKQRIIGKDDAIALVANAVRIRRTHLDFHPARPDGTFLLVGPSGVGKTEFAFAFAEALLGEDRDVVVLDMADYTEEEDIADLLVTLYPGTETFIEGSLTTPVRNNPRSVILLRGLEHAHAAVHRMLLHILERGIVVDAQGEVAFDQTIIFATTRLHPDESETVEQIGFTRSMLSREDRCRRMLEERFGPELIAAFNEVLYFQGLTPEDVKRIARYKVQKVVDRLKRQRRGVVISEKVYETFIKEEEVRRAGARYLNRALAENLFTPLSKFLLSHAETRNITVEVEGDRVVIHPTVRLGR
jgi:ATP-dependent Clp protease ATP-binding subunit ClpA